MSQFEYPALFVSSDEASNKNQKLYLALIRVEYGLLITSAVLSLNIFSDAKFYPYLALLFVFSIIVLLIRALKKPEQDWYKCRALAESVKTLSWRYTMKAAPYQGASAQTEFRDNLHEVFETNIEIAKIVTPDWSGNDQITQTMEQVRLLDLDERKNYYLSNRVVDQKGWYTKKAVFNQRRANGWLWFCGFCYLLAGSMLTLRGSFPELTIWPIEPLIVMASSALGWMQIKKFNELTAAYTVTAHEVGLLQPKLASVVNEEGFSDFVIEAELAFSREHTLWIARQAG